MRRLCFGAVLSLYLLAAPLVAATIPFIELQPVIVQNTATDAEVQNDVTYAKAIFAQIGLDVDVFTTLYSATLPATMDVSTSGNLGHYVVDSTWQPFPILTAWYVGSIVDSGTPGTIRGDSFALTNGFEWRYGIGISGPTAANDTLAHEIGHILTGFYAWWQPDASPDQGHSTDPNNVLAYGGIRNLPASLAAIGTVDQIQPVQRDAILDSPWVFTPEPVPVLLIGSGFVAFGLARRRRLAA